jgi:REP element-mobilizing transposase RayT
MVTVRSRGKLPHWERSQGVYFVTFRLADSLPRAVAQAFELERKDIVATANAMRRDLSPAERRRLTELFDEKVESYLDAGSGLCFLSKPAVAIKVAEALRHFHGVRYRLFAWCVMPNHVHAVFQPLEDWKLSEVLHTWKSYSAKEANRILRRSGDLWQREYYDHLIRNREDFQRCVHYVLQNPGKAGLRDWPWVGTTLPE